MHKLIVFDWDGTLMDSERKIVNSVLAALQDLEEPPVEPERIRNVIGLGLMESVQSLFPDHAHTFYLQFIERYRHNFLTVDQTPMPLFQGARETLIELQEAGYILAIATGKARPGLDRVLNETGLFGYFTASRCADESLSKPHPRMLEEVMDMVGVARRNTLMVGDTEYDLQMAVNAGVDAIGVTYGVHDHVRLLKHAPLVCLERITDLPPWLRGD